MTNRPCSFSFDSAALCRRTSSALAVTSVCLSTPVTLPGQNGSVSFLPATDFHRNFLWGILQIYKILQQDLPPPSRKTYSQLQWQSRISGAEGGNGEAYKRVNGMLGRNLQIDSESIPRTFLHKKQLLQRCYSAVWRQLEGVSQALLTERISECCGSDHCFCCVSPGPLLRISTRLSVIATATCLHSLEIHVYVTDAVSVFTNIRYQLPIQHLCSSYHPKSHNSCIWKSVAKEISN